MATKDAKDEGVTGQVEGFGSRQGGAVVPSPSSRPSEDTIEPTTTPPRPTPLPKKQMGVLTVVLMTESVCGTMLLPFVPRLIAYLKHITVEEAGYYTGILVGLFMLGQVVSSKLWGYMSDTYGRKVPLTSGLLAGALAMLFFGYTKSFVLCCVLRFVHGFFNGNTLVAKTMIADLTDKTNEAQGFALVSITWGVGTLFGPFIGGFLYNPTEKSYLKWLAGGSLHDFFANYPAFLPSFTIFLYTMTALLFCIFLLKETNAHRKHFKDTKLGRWMATFLSGKSGTTAGDGSIAPAAATDVVFVADDNDVADQKTASKSSPERRTREGAADEASNVKSASETDPVHAAPLSVRRKLTYMQAMRIDELRNITIFYMLLSGSDMTYGEILPLWGNADNKVGGMGLSENSVALLMLSYAIPSIIGNLFFHRVCHLLQDNYIVFWRYSLIMYAATTLIIPCGSRMGSAGYYYVMLLGMARQVGVSWCYSLIHLLTAKAAPLGCVGSVYGISQSFASATRCVVPFIVAPIFAWSLRQGHVFPFNYYLVFLIAVVPAVVSVCMSFKVRLTRSETCELDLEVESTPSDDAYEPNPTGSRHTHRHGRARAPSPDHDESVYVSLASSFCTNPLHDTYVDLTELERANAAAAQTRRELRGMLAEEETRRAVHEDEHYLSPVHAVPKN